MKVLITGGAGFIGSNLIKKITSLGWEIDVIDSLTSQVHGNKPDLTSSTYLEIKDKSNIVVGSASDIESYKKFYHKEYDSIIVLASETGTGQSMYEAKKYCHSNITSIALLNDLIINKKIRTKNIVLSSSRAVYGDAFLDNKNNPIASKENDLLDPKSIYAVTKMAQENILLIGFNDIPCVIFRFQNVYGPGQSLINPYTGILSIFTTAIRNKEEINIFEDGLMSRDFIFIDDIIDGLIRGIYYTENNKKILNLGSGIRKTVIDVVNELKKHFDYEVPIRITGQKRLGDIRHNYADLSNSREFGFIPNVPFEIGIKKFVEWAKTQPLLSSSYKKSIDEISEKGFLK